MPYQQRRIGEYLRIIQELAEDVRGGWLDEPPPRGEVYVGVDYGTAEPAVTVAYVAEGGRVRVVPQGWPWTPEMSEDVRRYMRQTQSLFRGANEHPEDLLPDWLREEQWTVPPEPRVPEVRRPSRQPPPSRREWWR